MGEQTAAAFAGGATDATAWRGRRNSAWSPADPRRARDRARRLSRGVRLHNPRCAGSLRARDAANGDATGWEDGGRRAAAQCAAGAVALADARLIDRSMYLNVTVSILSSKE